MTFGEIFEKLTSEVSDDRRVCFNFFKMRMIAEIEQCSELPNNWQEVEVDEKEEAVKFFNLALNTLEKIEIILDRDGNEKICPRLVTIERALKKTLENEFEVKLPQTESISPRKVLTEVGLPHSPLLGECTREKGYLKLQEIGERTAREFSELLKSSVTRQRA